MNAVVTIVLEQPAWVFFMAVTIASGLIAIAFALLRIADALEDLTHGGACACELEDGEEPTKK